MNNMRYDKLTFDKSKRNGIKKFNILISESGGGECKLFILYLYIINHLLNTYFLLPALYLCNNIYNNVCRYDVLYTVHTIIEVLFII